MYNKSYFENGGMQGEESIVDCLCLADHTKLIVGSHRSVALQKILSMLFRQLAGQLLNDFGELACQIKSKCIMIVRASTIWTTLFRGEGWAKDNLRIYYIGQWPPLLLMICWQQ